jgi:hypothetical protein
MLSPPFITNGVTVALILKDSLLPLDERRPAATYVLIRTLLNSRNVGMNCCGAHNGADADISACLKIAMTGSSRVPGVHRRGSAKVDAGIARLWCELDRRADAVRVGQRCTTL